MKIRNYNIKNLSQVAYVKGRATAGIVEDIKISGSLALDLLLRFTKTENTTLDSLIKVRLPENRETAMSLLNNGIEYDNRKYVALATTTSFMKKETKDGEIEEKCEYFFIGEEHQEFVDFFEDIISLGKLTEKKNAQSMEYLNKDIVSRISLTWSRSGKMPNYSWKDKIVVLPEATYNYTDTYVKMDTKALEQGRIALTEPSEENLELTAFDGFGLGSDEFFNEVSKSYRHKIDWCTIRTSLGIKGLVARFDFNTWLDDHYTGDTEFFQKREDGYYTQDIFGSWVNVSKAHLILNESQVKWAKHWKGQTLNDVYETIESQYGEYADILLGMYIMNTNRSEVPNYTKMNYQPLNVLNLTQSEMAELTAYDEQCYKDVFFGDDLDKKKIFLGHLARENSEDISHTTKISHMLSYSDDFFNTKVAREHMKHLAQSSLDKLAGGKFYIKGHFKSLACDPVAYLSYMVNREITDRALCKGEFYSPSETGKRVFSRNPLASFIEPVKAELKECERIEKYLKQPYAKDIVFFNQVDDTAKTLSGADMDGDQALVIDNDIVYNSVIDSVKFHNEADGAKGEAVPYTKENVYNAVIRTAGNTIGSIAIATAKLNTYCQDIPYKVVSSGRCYTKNELIAIFKAGSLEKDQKFLTMQKNIELIKDDMKYYSDMINYSQDETYEAEMRVEQDKEELERANAEMRQYAIAKFHEWLEGRINGGHIIDLLETATEQELKDIVTARFKEQAPIIFYCLYLNMKSIDSVKTMKPVTEEEKGLLKDALKRTFESVDYTATYNIGKKYPAFLYKLKDYVQFTSLDNYNRSALTLNAKRVYRELIKPIADMSKGSDSRRYDFKFFRLATGETTQEVREAVRKAYELYTEVAKYSRYKQEAVRNKEWDEVDREIATILEPFMGEEFFNQKALALLEFEHSLRFTLKYFDDVLFHFVDKREIPVKFKEDENALIELFHKHYNKIMVTTKPSSMHDSEHYKAMARRSKKAPANEREICLVRAGNKDGHIDIAGVEYFIVSGNRVLTQDGEEIGAIYEKDSFGYADGQTIRPLYRDITKSSFGLYFRG